MEKLNSYLKYIFENNAYPEEIGFGINNLSYYLINGKIMDNTKRAYGGKREYRPSKYGSKIGVDVNLKESWLKLLNKNKKIEIFSVCEGHNKNYLAHVGFRTKINSLNEEKLKQKLNNVPNSKCNYWTYPQYMIEDKPELKNVYMWVCTCPFWYKPNHKKWEDWFDKVSIVIGDFK